jgi:hypothetical protein
MKTKHTPAPWRTVDDAQGPCMVMHPLERGVCIASLTDAHKPSEGFIYEPQERIANARLIAAAPDMYDACDAALLLLTCTSKRLAESRKEELVTLLRTALKKARDE